MPKSTILFSISLSLYFLELLLIFLIAFIRHCRRNQSLNKAKILRPSTYNIDFLARILKTPFYLTELAYKLFKKSLPIFVTVIEIFKPSFL